HKAKENLSIGGKTGGRGRPKGLTTLSNPINPINSREELAKAANLSEGQLAKIKKIAAEAPEEVKEALRNNETSINAEYKKLTVHVGQNSGENEWYTPTEFVAAARDVMGGIDCDPASSEVANKTVKAKKYFDKESNGLGRKWNGKVFLNPPYAQPLMSQFAEAVSAKFESDEIEQAVVLVNNATETGWFARMAENASAICFPSGRIKFLDPSGAKGAPLQGQAVLYFGPNHKQFCKRFADIGIVCHVV
ncbi:MAG: DNA N-6-adenine-methyltransferase, partial [Planctomycetota bacterium]|nr:DNA N-6-adenine-methyltransferase [Planctomycetota bacterium]